MPSGEVHRKIGFLLLNFYDPEVDKLIDCDPDHDATRYDLDKAIILIEQILKRDDNRVRYAMLHHYLDRLVDLLVSEILRYIKIFRWYEGREEVLKFWKVDPCDIIHVIKKDLTRDPCNIFNLFITPEDEIVYCIYKRYDSRRRGELKRRFREQIEKLKKLRETRPELYTYIAEKTLEVVDKIKQNFLLIIKIILFEDEQVNRKLDSALSQVIRGEIDRTNVRDSKEIDKIERIYRDGQRRVIGHLLLKCLG